MEENLLPELPPTSPDLAETEGCKNELTTSNSDLSSLTADNLEVTFHHLNANFTVLRDGCWQKINFKRNQPLFDITVDSRDVLNSTWALHIKCGGKHCTNTSADLQEYSMLPCGKMKLRGKRNFPHRVAANCKQIHVSNCCHQDSDGITTEDPAEVSDQNFVDGGGEEARSESMIKRLKTAVADVSTQYHIVRSGKFSTLTSCSSEENKNFKNVHQKTLRELSSDKLMLNLSREKAEN